MTASGIRLTCLLVAASILVLAAGCGQSGPLYIPDDPSRIEMPPPAAEPAEEDEDGDQDGR